ncbi:MAG: hypothetical protein Q9168_006165 [Polycauliona sp. 1 TL-2023]
MLPIRFASELHVNMGNTSSQLRPPTPSRNSSPPSPQDDAAASAQLLAENSLAGISSPDQTEVQREEKRGRKKSKPMLSVLETASDAGNIQAEHYDSSHDVTSKFVGAGQENDHGLGTPHSSYDLDQIDENEEGVSSLFQEYESQATLAAFGFIEPPQHLPDSPATLNQHFTGEALAKEQSRNTRSQPNGGTKRKRGESCSRMSSSDSSQLHDGTQEPLNGTGQHAFELDFEAFDQIFANQDTYQANPFSDESGYDLPHGTELSEDWHQTHDDLPPQSNAGVADVVSPPGKLPRITYASRKKKRRRMETPNSIDSQVPAYISPYAEDEGHQDSVLPGIEDTQARSSPEIPYSQAPGLSHGTSCPSSEAQRTETPPLRLEKPSQIRGNKKQRGGQKGQDYKPPLQELSAKGGMFRDDEIRTLERFRDRYCEEEGVDKRRFNELIHTNVRGRNDVKRLYDAIYEEIPYRTHQSVLRFCRRNFHNFAVRGSWTAVDDENLRDAVAKKGTSWKAVGSMLDRFPEDCRDRYRNYIVNSEKRNTDTWAEHEVQNLVKAVNDCMRLLRGERARAKEDEYEGREVPESEPESDQEVQDLKLINWQIVSDRMGGTRSRLQCAYKFNHLKKEDRDYYFSMIRRFTAGKVSTSRAHSKRSRPWRLVQSIRKLRNMRAGDKYDFLQLFANCGAVSESNIPWRSLGDKALRKRWKNVDIKAALETFKEQVPGSERMEYQEVVNRVYTKIMAEDSGNFDDRWDPNVHGDINGAEMESQKPVSTDQRILQSEQVTKKCQQQSGRYKKLKSAMFVDSDDDDEEPEDSEAYKQDDRTDAKCDRSDTPQADSLEESTNRQQSPEMVQSSDEGEGMASQRSWPRSACSMEEEDNPNAISSSGSGTGGTHILNSDPVHDPGLSSDSDTDDSLFNGDSGDELVARLQSLRDA